MTALRPIPATSAADHRNVAEASAKVTPGSVAASTAPPIAGPGEAHHALDRARRHVGRGQLGRCPGQGGEDGGLRGPEGRGDDGNESGNGVEHPDAGAAEGRHRGTGHGGGADQVGGEHHDHPVVPVAQDGGERRRQRRRRHTNDEEEPDAGGAVRVEGEDGESDRRSPVAELRPGERELESPQARVAEHLAKRCERLPRPLSQPCHQRVSIATPRMD